MKMNKDDIKMFLNERVRICSYHTGNDDFCRNKEGVLCPFCSGSGDAMCNDMLWEDPDEAIAIVQKWSEDHPIETPEDRYDRLCDEYNDYINKIGMADGEPLDDRSYGPVDLYPIRDEILEDPTYTLDRAVRRIAAVFHETPEERVDRLFKEYQIYLEDNYGYDDDRDCGSMDYERFEVAKDYIMADPDITLKDVLKIMQEPETIADHFNQELPFNDFDKYDRYICCCHLDNRIMPLEGENCMCGDHCEKCWNRCYAMSLRKDGE